MTAMMHIAEPLLEAQRNLRIYAGDIIVFRGFPRVVEFIDILRTCCVDRLGDEPQQVHKRESDGSIAQASRDMRAMIRQYERVQNAWRSALTAVGADMDATYGDGVVLRVQPPQKARITDKRLAPLAAHRDTWGSNIAAQTNWWAPLYETVPERTLALFPNCFKRPVTNDSAGWDFRFLVRAQKSGSTTEYPLLPTASEPLPQEEALAVSLLPGDLLCFSGAHLHASVPNTTETTRLSFETRTVNGHDALADRGAPNVDGGAIYTTYQMFKHIQSGQTLGKLTSNWHE